MKYFIILFPILLVSCSSSVKQDSGVDVSSGTISIQSAPAPTGTIESINLTGSLK